MSFLSSIIHREIGTSNVANLPEQNSKKINSELVALTIKEYINESGKINAEKVCNELVENYGTYNMHHIRSAKSPEEKYEAALKYVACGYAMDELINNGVRGEYLSQEYSKCGDLRYLLSQAIDNNNKSYN